MASDAFGDPCGGEGEDVERCIHKSVECNCAESQSQQYRWLVLTPNLLRLVLRTQPRSWPTAKFIDNLWMHWMWNWFGVVR